MQPNAVARRAEELVYGGIDRESAVAEIIDVASNPRHALEEARDHFIERLHRNSEDFEATRRCSS